MCRCSGGGWLWAYLKEGGPKLTKQMCPHRRVLSLQPCAERLLAV